MTDPYVDAAKYFGKKKAGKDPTVEKWEKAIGVESVPMAPNTSTLPSKPPPTKNESEKKLKDKSKGGSPPFTDTEMKRGYRKI